MDKKGDSQQVDEILKTVALNVSRGTIDEDLRESAGKLNVSVHEVSLNIQLIT